MLGTGRAVLMFDSIAKSTKTNGHKEANGRKKVLVLFGTRPEAIKLAPVIHELKRRFFETIVVSSSQHKQLLKPFLESLSIVVDHDLGVMRRNQSPRSEERRVGKECRS